MPPYDPLQYRQHMELQELLELADSMHENEFYETSYEFRTAAAVVWLRCNWPSHEFSLSLSLPSAELPVMMLTLRCCEELRVVSNSKENFLECIGRPVSAAGSAPLCGFRLFLRPCLRVEPFYLPPT